MYPQSKYRPLVDPSVFELAEHWMQDYETIADREDLIWDLAADIQDKIEDFFDWAETQGRVKER